jgi:hypothetical protein
MGGWELRLAVLRVDIVGYYLKGKRWKKKKYRKRLSSNEVQEPFEKGAAHRKV